jgi:two-component system sensor histidine kinase RegB
MDDGRGYPPDMLGRIGDPFIRRRAPISDPERPEYEGMGLGLFIAKTLLERSGADLTFANGSDSFRKEASRAARTGALVEVSWPRNAIEVPSGPLNPALGLNQPLRG